MMLRSTQSLSVLFRLACALAAMGPLLSRPATADDKKPEKKEMPKAISVAPFALVRGATSTVRIRGIGLAEATAVRFDGGAEPLTATIRSKGKSDPPKGLEAPKFGDSQVEVEVKLPADSTVEKLTAVVTTKDGETAPLSVMVVSSDAVVDEKEPNGGFRTAQEIAFGKTIRGTIQEPSDVDVYQFKVEAGREITAEIDAARHGSPLDSLLTLYDAAEHVVAVNDDSELGSDSLLRFTPAAAGVYYLSVTDANDIGSPSHAYLLTIRARAGLK